MIRCRTKVWVARAAMTFAKYIPGNCLYFQVIVYTCTRTRGVRWAGESLGFRGKTCLGHTTMTHALARYRATRSSTAGGSEEQEQTCKKWHRKKRRGWSAIGQGLCLAAPRAIGHVLFVSQGDMPTKVRQRHHTSYTRYTTMIVSSSKAVPPAVEPWMLWNAIK